MTVKELIEALHTMPYEAIVRIANDSHSILTKVEKGDCYGCQRPEVTLR